MQRQRHNRGILIAFDGIDGSGKSTHSRLLADYLTSKGHQVVSSKEPTDGPWGRQLRASASTGRLSPEDELELFLRDRTQHVKELIDPSLEAGKTVMLDRYYFSTMAYQGSRGFDPAEIRRQNEEFAPVPSHLFILDLDVDEALSRIGARGDTANEFEKRDALQKCREVFLGLVGEPFVHLISTAGTPDEVHRQIVAALADEGC